MPRRVPATEAKTRFGAIADWAVENEDEVIVESRGEPKVAIIPFEEYQRLAHLREEARRRAALSRLERLRERVRARNQDLDEEQAESLADRFTREVITDMVREGKVKYGGDA
jgi:prevent-host-death family protein